MQVILPSLPVAIPVRPIEPDDLRPLEHNWFQRSLQGHRDVPRLY